MTYHTGTPPCSLQHKETSQKTAEMPMDALVQSLFPSRIFVESFLITPLSYSAQKLISFTIFIVASLLRFDRLQSPPQEIAVFREVGLVLYYCISYHHLPSPKKCMQLKSLFSRVATIPKRVMMLYRTEQPQGRLQR